MNEKGPDYPWWVKELDRTDRVRVEALFDDLQSRINELTQKLEQYQQWQREVDEALAVLENIADAHAKRKQEAK